MSGAAPGGRLHQLDGLRGLAALGVVVHHVLLSLPAAEYAALNARLLYTPLKIVVFGRPFVIVFFVLSGYVLTASLTAGRPPSFPGYVAKRACRIYLPYLVSILFSASLFLLLAPLPDLPLSSFTRDGWASGLARDVLLGHVLLLGDQPGSSLNMVNWSLVHEIRISLLMPPLVWLMARAGLAGGVLLALAIGVAADGAIWSSGYALSPYFAGSVDETLLYTAHFIPYFIAGGLLFLHREAIGALLAGRGVAGTVSLLLLAAAGLMSRRDAVQGLGASLLVALTTSLPVLSAGLSGRWAQFLGRISYSLYLVHVPVLLGLLHASHGRLTLLPLAVLTLAVSIGLACAGYRFVERPSIALGRALERGLSPRRPCLGSRDVAGPEAR